MLLYIDRPLCPVLAAHNVPVSSLILVRRIFQTSLRCYLQLKSSFSVYMRKAGFFAVLLIENVAAGLLAAAVEVSVDHKHAPESPRQNQSNHQC